MCFYELQRVTTAFKSKSEIVTNAVTDGSELIWKQKAGMIMAAHSKIKKQSSQ